VHRSERLAGACFLRGPAGFRSADAESHCAGCVCCILYGVPSRSSGVPEIKLAFSRYGQTLSHPICSNLIPRSRGSGSAGGGAPRPWRAPRPRLTFFPGVQTAGGCTADRPTGCSRNFVSLVRSSRAPALPCCPLFIFVLAGAPCPCGRLA